MSKNGITGAIWNFSINPNICQTGQLSLSKYVDYKFSKPHNFFLNGPTDLKLSIFDGENKYLKVTKYQEIHTNGF